MAFSISLILYTWVGTEITLEQVCYVEFYEPSWDGGAGTFLIKLDSVVSFLQVLSFYCLSTIEVPACYVTEL